MKELCLSTALGELAALHRPGEREHDDPAALPALCLHGWLDNAASFVPLSGHLSHRELLALDFPGHGHSPHRAGHLWYHYVDYVAAVAAVVDNRGWPQFDLIGHSLGGAVACAFTAAFPERVRRLVLIEGIGPLSASPEDTTQRLRRALGQLADIGSKRRRVFQDPALAVRARQAKGNLSEPVAATLVARSLEPVDGGHRWRSDPRLTLATPQYYTEPQVLDLLGNIRCPVLNIHADPPTPLLSGPQARHRLNQIRQLHSVAVPGNHHLHMENPAPVAAAIEDFLNLRNPSHD